MKLIHRYILRELMSPALLGLLVFTFVLLLQAIFEIAGLLFQPGVQGSTVGQVFLAVIPSVLSMTIPMAILVGALLGFGRLATDREVMAMRASGLHIGWLVWPTLVFGVVISGMLLLGNMFLMPRLALQARDLSYQLLFQTITSLEPGQAYDEFSTGDQPMEFMFEERGEEIGELRGVVIHTERIEPGSDSVNQLYLVAESGHIAPNMEHRTIEVSLNNGSVLVSRQSNRGEDEMREFRFERLVQHISPDLGPVLNGRVVRPPSEMSRSQILEEIQIEENLRRRADLRVDLMMRWVFPFSVVAFMLIGIPFGVVTKASGKGLGLGLSFLFILLYYGLLEWGKAMVESEKSWGPVAMWTPNIILSLIGVIMIWRVSRQ